jgi:hypothetical protein
MLDFYRKLMEARGGIEPPNKGFAGRAGRSLKALASTI